MSLLPGKHAVVVGAGIGGLAAAMALSQVFETVTVLERDALPTKPAARVGTPQSRLVHILLAGGLRALKQSFPNLEGELARLGAVRAHVGSEIHLELPGFDPFPKRHFDFYSTCMTRPLLEWVLRQDLERQPNVRVHARRRATELTTDRGQVTGARFEDAGGEKGVINADLVVDASSKGALTLETLDRLSLPRPVETEIGVDVGYATLIFEKPRDRSYDWKLVIQRPDRSNGRSGFITPIENDQWHVNLAGINGDFPPDTLDEYLAFAKSLRVPTIYEAIKDAVPVGSIHRFILRDSIRRRFADLVAFPDGVVPIGDAICRFNPAYGQGMSVAAQEADVLRRLILARVEYSDPLAGLPLAFFSAIEEVLDGPWSIAEMDLAYPKTRGLRTPLIERKLKENAALLQLAAKDAAIHELWAEVTNLLSPTSVLDSLSHEAPRELVASVG